jgi:hypothetical protein
MCDMVNGERNTPPHAASVVAREGANVTCWLDVPGWPRLRLFD